MYKGLTDYGDYYSRAIKKAEKNIEIVSFGVEYIDKERIERIFQYLRRNDITNEKKISEIQKIIDERKEDLVILGEAESGLEYEVKCYLEYHPEEKVKLEESEENADGRE